MKLKKLTAVVGGLLICSQLAGCMGTMGLSSMVTLGNLKAVDNRYGRAGLYVLLAPVYGIAATGDLFIFNSIEFWTGKNPITGKKALADTPVATWIKVNEQLNKELTSAPLKDIKLTSAKIHQLDDDTLAMTVTFDNSRQQEIKGQKNGEVVDFYVDNQFITSVSKNELKAYTQARA